jgi:myo-inositol-1(or 4)-monophosphatase
MATNKSKAAAQNATAGKKTAPRPAARSVAKSAAKPKVAPARAKAPAPSTKAPLKAVAVKPTAAKASSVKKAPPKAAVKSAPKKAVTKSAKPAAKTAPTPSLSTGKSSATSSKTVVAKASSTPAKSAAPKPVATKPVAAKPVPAAAKAAPAKAPVAQAPSVKVETVAPPVVAARDSRVSRGTGKLLPRTFLFGLSEAIKVAVAPMVQQVKGREVVDSAVSGDATFEIDKVAEKALLNYLKAERAPVAYYSEDSGYSTFSNDPPQHLLIVDPIDGTRAAKNGFEACVVAIAATSVIERPTMADVESACVMEIMGDRTFYAERGKGARIYSPDGKSKKPKLSENVNLETVAWSMTVPARPAALIFPTAAPLIDLTSLKGGFFACNSTSYSLTRLLTNQLDACVDFASRYMKEIPELVKDQFINAGRGIVLGIAPYDMAASLLIAREAGCTVTDAFGGNFDDVLLLDSSENNHQSIIAASNAVLHEKLMSILDTRIKQYVAAMHRARG